MAFQNVHDRTESDFWKRTMNAMSTDVGEPTTTQRERGSGGTRRYRNNGYGHSYDYKWFPDHHQLNVMDYVQYLHDEGYLDYTSEKDNQFRLNQDIHTTQTHLNALRSVVITLKPYIKRGSFDPKTGKGIVDPNAQYNGHRLTNASFVRYSNGQGRDSYAHNGFDSLTNFMAVIHNHYHPSDTIKPDIHNKKIVNRLNRMRADFINKYHAKYGTYQSGFSFDGTNLFKKHYRNNSNLKGVGVGKNSSYQVVSLGTQNDEPFRDTRSHFKDNFTGSQRWLRNSVIYDYLYKKRRIPPATLYKYGRMDNMRSYNGRFTFKVSYCPDIKTAKSKARDIHYHNHDVRIQQDDRKIKPQDRKHFQRGFYNSKTHKFYTYEKSPFQLDPMVEFPYWARKRRDVRVPLKTAIAILKKDPHLMNHAEYRMIHPEDNPNTKDNRRYMVKSVATNQWHVTGADRIYLKPDWKRTKLYKYHKHYKNGHLDDYDLVAYTGTNGQVDVSKFDRGKQIARNSQTNFGAWFRSRQGNDVLYVTEATIDAYSKYILNHATNKHENASYFPMEGVTKSDTINTFLHTVGAKKGDFNQVYMCVDNDKAGHRGIEKIMASIHNKDDFVNRYNSRSINPVTGSPQQVLIQVPGVRCDPTTGKISKIIPGDLGRFHLKDENDVLQAANCSGKYKSLRGTNIPNELKTHPNLPMNINQYNQMIMDDMFTKMNRCSVRGVDNASHAKKFMGLYSSFQKSVDKGAGIDINNPYLAKMRQQYRQMDGVGRGVLNEYMDKEKGHGMSNNSSYDLARYTRHAPEVSVNRDEARTITSSKHSPETNIQNHVDKMMDLMKDDRTGKSQKLYDLALRSVSKMMPAARNDVTGSRRKAVLNVNGQLYKYVMGVNKGYSHYNMLQNNLVHRMEARDSIHSCVAPVIMKDKGLDADVAAKASQQYLKKHGLKPISAQEVFNKDGLTGHNLYSDMQKSEKKYAGVLGKSPKHDAVNRESKVRKTVPQSSAQNNTKTKASAVSNSSSYSPKASSSATVKSNRPQTVIASLNAKFNKESVKPQTNAENKRPNSVADSKPHSGASIFGSNVNGLFSFSSTSISFDDHGAMYRNGKHVTESLTDEQIADSITADEDKASSVADMVQSNPSAMSSIATQVGSSSFTSMSKSVDEGNSLIAGALDSDAKKYTSASKAMANVSSPTDKQKSNFALLRSNVKADEGMFDTPLHKVRSGEFSANKSRSVASDKEHESGVSSTAPSGSVREDPDNDDSQESSSSQAVRNERSTSQTSEGSLKAKARRFNNSDLNSSLMNQLHRDSKMRIQHSKASRSNSSSFSRSSLAQKGAQNQAKRDKKHASNVDKYRNKHQSDNPDWK